MKKDENLCSWIFFSWILMIDDISQRQTNHPQTFGRQCRKIICQWIFTKQQKQKWINVQNVCRMKGDCSIHDCVRAVFVATEFIKIFIFEWCQVYHKMRFKIFYFMLYADFGGPEHANLLNNRKLQKHQIHCNLLCFDFHKCPIFRPKCTPWLKPSTSLQPFFLFSARSDCPSPENFWLSIFHPPDIFISGKRPKTWFQWGAFYWFWTADWL